MSESLEWGIDRASQVFERLRMFRGIGTHDWKAVLYQSQQILADLDILIEVAKTFRDKAIQQLRKEAGLDA